MVYNLILIMLYIKFIFIKYKINHFFKNLLILINYYKYLIL